MAVGIWNGGTHRVDAPGVWDIGPIVAGDTGLVQDGNVIAANQTLPAYFIDLAGTFDTATFTAYNTTITGGVGAYPYYMASSPYEYVVGDGTIDFVGPNTNAGSIDTGADYLSYAFSHLRIVIEDVFSAGGQTTVQQGILTNTGEMGTGDTGPTMSIAGASDALLVNNGTISADATITIGVAVTGTGTIVQSSGPRDLFGPNLVFEKAVGAGQTVQSVNGIVVVEDPINFRATIEFTSYYGGEFDFTGTATSAFLINHTFTLMNGSTVLAQFKTAADLTAYDLLVSVSNGVTRLMSVYSGVAGSVDPNTLIPIAMSGTVPAAPPIVLPAAVQYLPSFGPNVLVQQGYLYAASKVLNNYAVRLDGSSPFSPTLTTASAKFDTGFMLRVDPVGGSNAYGVYSAVGYNTNAGTIVTAGVAYGPGSRLDVILSNIGTSLGNTVLTGVLNNTGTIQAGTSSTISITGDDGSKLINTGKVIANGAVFIGTNVTDTGSMTVGDHSGTAGSLELGAAVSTGQSINLQAGALTIDATAQFFATIYDFDSRDTITLKGVNVSGVTYNNGKLLLDGGADGALHFHRPAGVTYDTSSFLLSHSGTDTVITTNVHTV